MMDPVDTSFGSDQHGLVWGYRFSEGEPPRPIGCDGAPPDGKKLAYSRYISDTNREIFVRTLATYTDKRLTFSAGEDQGPTWSPDGTRIAFSSHRSGRYQIWTMNSGTGGGLTRITSVTWVSGAAWAH